MTDAPEAKWLTPNGGLPTGNGWTKSQLVEWTRTDHSQALIAAAERRGMERAACEMELAAHIMSHRGLATELETYQRAARAIRALTPADAQAAYDKAIADAERRGMERAAEIARAIFDEDTEGQSSSDPVIADRLDYLGQVPSAIRAAMEEK
jgi:hypothetical protein